MQEHSDVKKLRPRLVKEDAKLNTRTAVDAVLSKTFSTKLFFLHDYSLRSFG